MASSHHFDCACRGHQQQGLVDQLSASLLELSLQQQQAPPACYSPGLGALSQDGVAQGYPVSGQGVASSSLLAPALQLLGSPGFSDSLQQLAVLQSLQQQRAEADSVPLLNMLASSGLGSELLALKERLQQQSPTNSVSGGSSFGLQSGTASSNPLYKTELCRSWEETGTCRYGSKCQFSHGREELRPIVRHPRYKTEVCRTFSQTGTCPYGTRCRFIHPSNTLSNNGNNGIKATSGFSAPESPRVRNGYATPPGTPAGSTPRAGSALGYPSSAGSGLGGYTYADLLAAATQAASSSSSASASDVLPLLGTPIAPAGFAPGSAIPGSAAIPILGSPMPGPDVAPIGTPLACLRTVLGSAPITPTSGGGGMPPGVRRSSSEATINSGGGSPARRLPIFARLAEEPNEHHYYI